MNVSKTLDNKEDIKTDSLVEDKDRETVEDKRATGDKIENNSVRTIKERTQNEKSKNVLKFRQALGT